MTKAFVDTNIVLDWLLDRPPYSEPAVRLFGLAETGNFALGTSAVSLINTEYFLRKSVGSKTARQAIIGLNQLCQTIDAGQAEVTHAIHSEFKDFEDAFQYFCAVRWSADLIVTRNKKDFRAAELPLMDAAEFLATLV